MEEKENNQPYLPTIFPSLNHQNPEMVNEEAMMVSQNEEKFKEFSDKVENATQIRFLIGENLENGKANENKKKRKRRRIKSSEEVENQRMTHIEVERNRRKQMNEHLLVLRSLMPTSYVQRGDQASIIGGATEFLRELEQLLQCLESQKRRKLYGDDSLLMEIQNPPFFAPLPLANEIYEGGIQEEIAESKSCLADVEVKLIGFNAMIKILSKRRPGQLISTISALEDLQLNIIHTNITTIDQTVLYSFNVKISGETKFTADGIANLVQQIFSFIYANNAI
ncbi:PREDICTED: transcription factor FAMA-like isoform X2 [Nicotiana attenuata]|uniref:Transcription factor fama n=1 Tax=Nicotiana attenuata TaxID=49451 RepID=A0A1J6HVS9_NICAT|nr:PREDICTED: transcription factor FAMA-like isoform X2 [Nicotiana attenuata]XP_019255763.1 PREDICTED: transcription factor FAMA-like isoform X2 [Nicotiana attenuata]OIS96941.1 transcription factor fama [Nicotiana attenuata]